MNTTPQIGSRIGQIRKLKETSATHTSVNSRQEDLLTGHKDTRVYDVNTELSNIRTTDYKVSASSPLLSHVECKPIYDVSFNKFSAEHFSVGGLNKQAALKSDELKSIALQIQTVLLASHAENTNKTYSRIFQKWKLWAQKFPEIQTLPADPFYVSLFLIEFAEQTKSAANVRLTVPALKWAHQRR